MAKIRASVERAAALHRQAVATADAAAEALNRLTPDVPPAGFDARQRAIIASLASLAADVAPRWLSIPLDGNDALPPVGTEAGAEVPVRVGLATPFPGASFPVLVPALGVGHLAIDASPQDPRTEGLMRSVVLRLLTSMTPGTLRVRAIDPTGTVFAPFRSLFDGRIMPPPAAELSGMRTLIAEAEQWVRTPAPAGRHLLFAIAGLPAHAEPSDVARLTALASADPSARLTIVATGLPATEDGSTPLPRATTVTLQGATATVSGPPGSYGRDGVLGAPIEIDGDPAEDVLSSACQMVAEQARVVATLRMTDLLPSGTWQERSADGLATTVGLTGHAPLSLRLADLTPHWLVGGRRGAGKTALLVNVLYGLANRYSPDELALYLLDLADRGSFREFATTETDESWIPHARVVGIEADRAYALAVLRELDDETARRMTRAEEAGATRFAELRETVSLPRIVCVIDAFHVLLGGDDDIGRQAVSLLDSIARKGRTCGVHLILATQTMRGLEPLSAKRDSTFGQFPVRIALPGGSDVLDVRNSSAGALRLGTAVVNTAGGLGGPSGAARAHERLVDFPDPHAEPRTLATLRRRLWLARPAGAAPPHVFEGGATHHLPSRLPSTNRITAYVGRAMDVSLSLAGFPLDATPGRHLAVIGPSETGADILDAAARSLATQREPGLVRFVLAPLSVLTAGIAEELGAALARSGHNVELVDATGLQAVVVDPGATHTYVFGFGLDGAADLRAVLDDGPGRGVHLFGWWRGLRRFGEDTGGATAHDNVAGVVLLNVPTSDAARFLGAPDLDWRHRPNRALLHDRHEGRTEEIVPFVRRSAHPDNLVAPGERPLIGTAGERVGVAAERPAFGAQRARVPGATDSDEAGVAR